MNRDMQEIIRNQKPVTMLPAVTVQEACKAMHAHNIGAILITDDTGRLLGIFTGRDAVRVLGHSTDAGSSLLQEVMTKDPDTMQPHAHAIDALRLMRDGGFRHIPVVDGERLVGIVSRGDFRGLENDRLDVETGLWERIG